MLLDATLAAGLTLLPSLPAVWVVNCKAVGDGQKALLYLSHTLYCGVIQQADILRCDDKGKVSFEFRDAKTGKPAQSTLPGADCLWLVLKPVLHLRATPGKPARPAPERPDWRRACGQAMRVVRRRMPPLQAAGPRYPAAIGQRASWDRHQRQRSSCGWRHRTYLQ